MENHIKHYQKKLAYEIDAADLYEAIKEGQKIILIDTRRPNAFIQEHIPTAINLPHREMNETTTGQLDKSFLYVTYCDGVGCNASTKGALNLTQLGFAVKELIGGIDWWKRDGYATEGISKVEGIKIECAC